MEKQYYDHRTKLCGECYHHNEEGPRNDRIGKDIWPEGCGRYGYTFHTDRYEEDADNCPGFQTEEQYKKELSLKELLKRNKNKKK